MALAGPARRLTLFVGEADRHGHASLADVIVQRAQGAGLAGVTVSRGVEGYGASRHIQTARLVDQAANLPIVIEIVDTPDRIAAFAGELDEAMIRCFATIEAVDVRLHRGSPDPSHESG